MPDETARGRAYATEVRFGMRGLLVVMSVGAGASLGLAAFVRQFPPDAQVRLVLYWGVLGVALVAVFGYNARQRYLAEQRAGRSLFQLRPHSYFFPRATHWATLLLGVFLLTLGPARWVGGSFLVASDNPALRWKVVDFGSVIAVFSSGVGMTYLWWHRAIRVGEHGVIVRSCLLSWEKLRRFYWDACYPDVVVMEFQATVPKVAAKVAPEDRGQIEELLREKFAVFKETDKPAKVDALAAER